MGFYYTEAPNGKQIYPMISPKGSASGSYESNCFSNASTYNSQGSSPVAQNNMGADNNVAKSNYSPSGSSNSHSQDESPLSKNKWQTSDLKALLEAEEELQAIWGSTANLRQKSSSSEQLSNESAITSIVGGRQVKPKILRTNRPQPVTQIQVCNDQSTPISLKRQQSVDQKLIPERPKNPHAQQANYDGNHQQQMMNYYQQNNFNFNQNSFMNYQQEWQNPQELKAFDNASIPYYQVKSGADYTNGYELQDICNYNCYNYEQQ